MQVVIDNAQTNAQTLAVVEAWNDAANRQDAERLTELSDPNIEIIGPRGSGYGHQLLRDWLARAGLTLTTLRAFSSGNLVVLAQHGVWRSVESGEITEERDLASHYRVAVGRVLRFARYDTLAEAFAATGLTEADEVPIPSSRA
jgi:SnoaL-like protein